MDISRDEIGLRKQEGEILQQEIKISTTDHHQVSYELVPDSLVLTSTLPPDEKQLEADTSGHTNEFQEPNIEHIYTVESLGNTLTWGEKQILEPVDEVTDIQAITYD
jgi:hypothetical protein